MNNGFDFGARQHLEEIVGSLKKDEKQVVNSNWRKELCLTLTELNKIDLSNNQDYLLYRSLIADYLDLICFYYNLNGLEEFRSLLLEDLGVFDDSDSGFFKDPDIKIKNKRFPGLEESCQATLLRLEAVHDFCQIIPEVEGIVVGGSVSYGRFYSVRDTVSSKKGSDVDMLLFLRDPEELKPLTRAPFLSKEDRDRFDLRLRNFCDSSSDNGFEIFSQRFYYKDCGFTISFHGLPFDLVKRIAEDMNKDLFRGSDLVFLAVDHRSDPFKRPSFPRYNFSGKSSSFDLEVKKGELGYTSSFPVYSVFESEFYSSLYFNLVFPEKWILRDRYGELTPIIEKIHRSLRSKLELERTQDPSKSLLKSHIRYPIFRESILAEFDN